MRQIQEIKKKIDFFNLSAVLTFYTKSSLFLNKSYLFPDRYNKFIFKSLENRYLQSKHAIS